jgi:hypothetical protein
MGQVRQKKRTDVVIIYLQKKERLPMLPKSKREFFCDVGETITVTVTSAGTVHSVAFAKDNENWDGTPFVFTEPDDEFRSITIFMIFSNPNGGNYDIEISGNPGEHVHEESAPQDTPHGSLKDTSRGYNFFKKP